MIDMANRGPDKKQPVIAPAGVFSGENWREKQKEPSF